MPCRHFLVGQACTGGYTGITWLAKILYPEEFADIDLETLTKEFYAQFYDYELTTEKYEDFLSQES